MRSIPTLYQTTGTDYYTIYRNGGTDVFNSFTVGEASLSTFDLYNTSEVSGTAGQSGMVRTSNSSAKIGAQAEL